MQWKEAQKKPIIVRYREPQAETVRVPCEVFRKLYNIENGNGTYGPCFAEVEVIHTLEGDLYALPNRDYVVEGVKGELYPISREIFKLTYEVLGDE